MPLFLSHCSRQPTPSSSTTFECYIVKDGLAAVHAMKVHWSIGQVPLLILNPGTGWSLVVSFTPPENKPLVVIE